MFTIIMWLMLGPNEQPSSEKIKDALYETQSNCQSTAAYLKRGGFKNLRCIPVKVTIPYVR